MIKYDKKGWLIENWLTDEESRHQQHLRTMTIRRVYRELKPKSKGTKERVDEILGNDYLITIGREQCI